ncbi:GMC oxidoreductase, partial [Lophiostoma macrostomum CBS 122681]
PLSRGTVHVNASDPYGQHLFDFRVFSNPLDIELAINFIKCTWKYINTPTLARLQPVETRPGPNVSSSDTAAMEDWVHASSGPTSFHLSGTSAMMPKELGGVVDSNLRVYGIVGLRIVDTSIILLIQAHI